MKIILILKITSPVAGRAGAVASDSASFCRVVKNGRVEACIADVRVCATAGTPALEVILSSKGTVTALGVGISHVVSLTIARVISKNFVHGYGYMVALAGVA